MKKGTCKTLRNGMKLCRLQNGKVKFKGLARKPRRKSRRRRRR